MMMTTVMVLCAVGVRVTIVWCHLPWRLTSGELMAVPQKTIMFAKDLRVSPISILLILIWPMTFFDIWICILNHPAIVSYHMYHFQALATLIGWTILVESVIMSLETVEMLSQWRGQRQTSTVAKLQGMASLQKLPSKSILIPFTKCLQIQLNIMHPLAFLLYCVYPHLFFQLKQARSIEKDKRAGRRHRI